MTENSVLTHRNVGVLAVEAVEAPEVVTSAWIDEQLAETYERTASMPPSSRTTSRTCRSRSKSASSSHVQSPDTSWC